ncbi:MAG: hypothetical protein KME26_32030 [Oscillatoria princeps RMCB-10]|jgi:hypothetical protein|nr:hypothetical protein [Oscillatoria princeps RMCB-10]
MTEQNAEKKLSFYRSKARNCARPVTPISVGNAASASVIGASLVSDTGLTEDAGLIVTADALNWQAFKCATQPLERSSPPTQAGSLHKGLRFSPKSSVRWRAAAALG